MHDFHVCFYFFPHDKNTVTQSFTEETLSYTENKIKSCKN